MLDEHATNEIFASLKKPRPVDDNDHEPSFNEFLRNIKENLLLRTAARLPDARVNENFVLAFLLHDSFNAVAARKAGVDIIGINVGIIKTVCNDAIFATENGVFSWVGNAADDQKEMTASRADKDDPRDVSYFFLNSGYHFIFFHEIGHIMLGHVAWREQESGALSLGELDLEPTGLSPEQSEQGFMDRQSLELDADGYAIRSLLFSSLVDQQGSVPDNKSWEDMYGKGATRAITSFAAAYYAFRSFNDHATIQLSKAHPSLAFRQWEMIDAATNFVVNMGLFDAGNARSMFWQATSLADLIFEARVKQKGLRSNVWGVYNADAEAYLYSLKANLERLRPQLAEHARGPSLM